MSFTTNYMFVNFIELMPGLTIRNGTVEGRGVLRYDKNSNCYQTNGIEQINGSFVAGQLDGMATIQFVNQSLLRAPFRAGVLSGLTRLFSCQYGSCDFSYDSWNRPTWLSQVSTVRPELTTTYR